MSTVNPNGMSTICVSVIVPAYNASATIGETLEALSKQDCSLPFEVIVVDDGSLDNTADIVRSFASVKYIFQKNAGPASARNQGSKLAQGEYLAFTDSDCIPHKDWISQLMAGFAGGGPLNPARTVAAVAGSYGIANPENCLARCIFKEIRWRHNHLVPDFPDVFGSYNVCIQKNVFEELGGFNPNYRRASGEDNDLSYKLIRSGRRIYFQRKALVDHYHPTLVFKYLEEQYRHGFWRLKMYKDHPGMMRGDGYTYWKDIMEIFLAGCFFIGIILCPFNYVNVRSVGTFLLFPFLIFEIIWAFIMTHYFFEGVLFGFVLLCRAFARFLGFSTGISRILVRPPI